VFNITSSYCDKFPSNAIVNAKEEPKRKKAYRKGGKMSILAWIEDQRKLKLLNAPKYNQPPSDGSKGLWTRCDNCGVILYIKHLKENQRVCFGCGYHLQMNSQERIENLIDENTWRPLDETLSPGDPLEFRDQKPYIERLNDAQERTGLQDAVQTGTGMLDGIPIALGVMDFHFMGGSMGSVVGEKITRLIEYATQEGLTLILVCASGGARMQEGIFSLMQMAKISSALQIYQSCANLLYISVLTSPTTGGVTASFAMLGDLIFAEPKALIGFAGRRVIEQTLQEDLPDDFQTSEYLLHHGLLDLIVPRCFLKQALSETITLYRDAPFKQTGHIPYGVQNPLYFLTEEKVRRRWQRHTHLTTVIEAGDSGAELQDSFTESKEVKSFINVDDPLSTSSTSASIASKVSSLEGLPTQQEEFGVKAPRGQGLTKLFNTSVNPPGELTQPLINYIDDQTEEVSGEQIDKKLTNLVEAWLKDSSCDESYREILVSFDAMFRLVAHNKASDTIIDEIDDLTSPSGASARLEEVSSQTEEKGFDGYPLHVRPSKGNTFLNQALLLGMKEKISWRAFYTNQRSVPKAHFLESLGLNRETLTNTPAPTPLEGQGWTNNREETLEKKFFYQTSKENR
jgi:acetyl-CoA carboxylase carboxyl transferase subunit beta